MKNGKYNFIIFIACIIIGILFVANFHMDDKMSAFNLTAREYHDLNAEKGTILKDIAKLRDKNDEYSDKIDDYEKSYKNEDEILGNVQKEIQYNNMIIGMTPVQGEGVEIVLSDGIDSISDGYADDNLLLVKTLHDNDMMEVINELKMAGAEAISVNNQRVILNSEIMCGWAFLSINGVKTPGPFTVKAIGNSTIMNSVLNRTDGYIQLLRNRDIHVSISEEKNIEIPSYNGDVDEFNNLKIDK